MAWLQEGLRSVAELALRGLVKPHGRCGRACSRLETALEEEQGLCSVGLLPTEPCNKETRGSGHSPACASPGFQTQITACHLTRTSRVTLFPSFHPSTAVSNT